MGTACAEGDEKIDERGIKSVAIAMLAFQEDASHMATQVIGIAGDAVAEIIRQTCPIFRRKYQFGRFRHGKRRFHAVDQRLWNRGDGR